VRRNECLRQPWSGVSFARVVVYQAADVYIVWPGFLLTAILSAFYSAVSGVRFRKRLIPGITSQNCGIGGHVRFRELS
jgi:chromate transport protein ChrA